MVAGYDAIPLVTGLEEQEVSSSSSGVIDDNPSSSSSSSSRWNRRCCPKWRMGRFRSSVIPLLIVVGLMLLVTSGLSYISQGSSKNTTSMMADATDEEDDVDWSATAESSLQSLNANLLRSPRTRHCESTVLLVRHCDDHGPYAVDDEDWGNKHCSHMGFKRTRYLASLFGAGKRWPQPRQDGLFALLPEQPQGVNFRQIETLLPLAKATNSTVRIVGDPSQLANTIFSSLQTSPDETMCGQVSVAAWKHAFIPEVAARLGCGPHQGCEGKYPDESFDMVWMLQFVFEPSVKPLDEVRTLQLHNSSLLSDDFGLLSQLGPAVDMNVAQVSKHSGWKVYGTVVNQFFDPLVEATMTRDL